MDWSKAKTILIVALLITNIIIGSAYISGINKEKANMEAAARNAAAYAQSRGVNVRCEIPAEKNKLPVLFVSLDRSGIAEECHYKGIAVETDKSFVGRIIPEGQGDADAELISASNALLKLIGDMGESDMTIDDISVVYWLDLSLGDDVAAKDTAVPAWKFSGPDGVYYIEAFGE